MDSTGFVQLIVGSAGSGKSTYCHHMSSHLGEIGRSCMIINLDPAAEKFSYTVDADIRDLISVQDTMEAEDMLLGPNGGLVFCLEYMMDQTEWLDEILSSVHGESVLIDCPGQIELYTHLNVMNRLCKKMHSFGMPITIINIMDCTFITDSSKYISGLLSSLATMIQLEQTQINILSKVDMLPKKQRKRLERYLSPTADELIEGLHKSHHEKFHKLNQSLANLVEEYNMISFYPLNYELPQSISDLLHMIDTSSQYYDHCEVKPAKYLEEAPEENE